MGKKYYLYTESVSSQRHVLSADELIDKKVEGEGYSSLFYYDGEILNYLEKNDSVSGFNGSIYGNHFVFDLDSPDLGKLSHDIVPLLLDLQQKSVDYTLFFSGRKGYHLYIPKDYVEYPDDLEDKFNVANKYLAQKIAKEYNLKKVIDLSIYDAVRIFRMPFSEHQATKKKKIYIDYDKDGGKNFKDKWLRPVVDETFIKENIFGDVGPRDVEPIWFINNIPDDKVNFSRNKENPSKDYFRYMYGDRYCIINMLNDFNPVNHRHQVGLRLISYWKNKFPFSYTNKLLRMWNENLQNPLPNKELDDLLKYYGRYNFSCKDHLLKKYCDKNCKYYTSRNFTSNLATPDDFEEIARNEINRDTSHDIHLWELYPSIRATIRPSWVTILSAAASVGKTTFLLNLIHKFTNTEWLFFSYEMTKTQVLKKFAKLDGLEFDLEDTKLLKKRYPHVFIYDKIDLAIDRVPNMIELIQHQAQKKFDAIAFDYLGLIPSKGDEKESAIKTTNTLKKVAKTTNTAVFAISQVPKATAGNGNEPLGLQAPKGSGRITATADLMINFHRPGKMKDGVADTEIIASIPKFRHGEDGYQVSLVWNGEKGRISEKAFF